MPKELRKGFDSAVLLVSWRLWKERNSYVFDNVACTTTQAARRVLDEVDEWIAVGFTAISMFLVAAGRRRALYLVVTKLFVM